MGGTPDRSTLDYDCVMCARSSSPNFAWRGALWAFEGGAKCRRDLHHVATVVVERRSIPTKVFMAGILRQRRAPRRASARSPPDMTWTISRRGDDDQHRPAWLGVPSCDLSRPPRRCRLLAL